MEPNKNQNEETLPVEKSTGGDPPRVQMLLSASKGVQEQTLFQINRVQVYNKLYYFNPPLLFSVTYSYDKNSYHIINKQLGIDFESPYTGRMLPATEAAIADLMSDKTDATTDARNLLSSLIHRIEDVGTMRKGDERDPSTAVSTKDVVPKF